MSNTLEIVCLCGKSYRFPESGLGRKATCRECGVRFRVTAEGPVPVTSSAARRSAPVPAPAPAPARTPAPAPVPVTRSASRRPASGPRAGLRRRGRARRAPRAGWVAGMVGAAVVLVAAGGIGWALTGTKDPLDFVPAGMDAVVRIDVRRSIDELGKADELDRAIDEKTVAKLGIDPAREIDTIVVAVDGSAAESQGQGVLVLVQGSFDPRRILDSEFGRQAKPTAVEYEGTTYYLVDGSLLPVPGLKAGVAWLGSGLLAIGSEDMLKKAIDTGAGRHESIRRDEAMGDLVASADSDSLFWCALRVPGELEASLPSEAKGLRSFLLGAKHEAGIVTLQATGGFGREEEARNARKAIETALEGTKGSGPSPLDEVIAGKSLDVVGPNLLLEIRIDTNKVDSAAQAFLQSFSRPRVRSDEPEIRFLDEAEFEASRTR